MEITPIATEPTTNASMTSNRLLWLTLSVVLTMLMAAGGLYAKWITNSITTQGDKLGSMSIANTATDYNLEILNAKLDIILRSQSLTYDGPRFRSSHNPQQGDSQQPDH